MTDSASANPWLGLNTYKENDRLYGRDREAEEVSDIIENNLLTIIYGRSGIGKSSLLQAGVFPRLRYNDQLPVYIRLEHNSETEYISQIVSKIQNESEKSKTNLICSIDISSIRTLAQLAASVTAQDGFTLIPRNITLVFDQFEELFTLPDKAHRQAMNEFFSQLSEMLNNTDSEHALRIVICLREDYLYFLEQASVNVPSLKRNRYSLQGLTRGQGRDVICLPRKGLVSEELAENILDKIDPEHSDVIAPAILSLFMHELYEKGKGTITQENISLFGDHIISNFYENGMKSVSPVALAFLEDRLVTSDGYRHFISYNDALAHGVAADELEKLKERRIITIEKVQKNQQIIEFSHDVLCPIVIRNRKERRLNEEAERLRAKNKSIKRRQAFIISLVVVAMALVGIFAFMYLELRNERQQMLANQSRFVAKEALELAKSGDYIKAMVLVAEVYPKNVKKPKRPFTSEAYDALRILNDSTARLERVIKDVQGINSAQFSPDGKLIVSATDDNTAKIWDIETGEKIITFIGHTKTVNYAEFSPDGKLIVTASDDESVRIWDAESGECLSILEGHNDEVKSSHFSHNGDLLVSNSTWMTRIWNIESKECILEHSNISKSCTCFSMDDNFLYIIDGSYVDILEIKSGERTISRLNNLLYFNSYPRFSSDCRYIVTPSLEIWDIQSGKCIHTFDKSSTNYSNYVEFSPDGKYIVSASMNNTAEIWDIEKEQHIATFRGHSNWVRTAHFSPDTKRIVSSSIDGSILIWNIEGINNSKKFNDEEKKNRSPRFSPDGTEIISIYDNDYTKIWDTKTGDCLTTVDIAPISFDNIKFSPDYKLAASCNFDGIEISDIETGNTVRVIKSDTESYYYDKLYFSNDSKLIAKISYDDHSATVWDIESGMRLMNIDSEENKIASFAFSPNGRTAITTYFRDTIAEIWNIESAECIQKLIGHTNSVECAQFSPNGDLAATGSYDKTAKIWNAETGECIKTITGHNGVVSAVLFSPDGKYLITSSRDNTTRVWDLQSDTQICSIEIGRYAEISPSGKYILAHNNEKSKVYHFYEPQELIDLTMKKLNNYTLSEEDRRTYYLE